MPSLPGCAAVISEADRAKSVWHEALWQLQKFIAEEKPSQEDVTQFMEIVRRELPEPRTPEDHAHVAHVQALVIAATNQPEQQEGTPNG